MFVPPFILRQCDELTQLLGTACSPYCLPKKSRDTERRRSPASIDGTADATEWDSIVLESEKVGRHVLSQSSNQIVRFAIPLASAEPSGWFAIGKSPGETSMQLELLFRAATEALRRKLVLEEQERIVIQSESDLHRSYIERQWSRKLNSNRSIRKRGSVQTKQAMESLRNLIDAEAIGLYIYQDDTAGHGLESAITSNQNWTLDDARQILQKISKPSIGDCLILNKPESSFSYRNLRSLVVVPIGADSIVGYAFAINRRRQGIHQQDSNEWQFSSRDADPLFELADYLLSEGFNQVHFQESEQLVLGVLRTMSNAIEARDPYTRGHSERVARLAYEIAVHLELSEVASQEIYLAGILHDVGKIGIPDSVLLKPGRLDDEEMRVIRQHPEIGHKILEELGKLSFALPGVLYHHERVDGDGYPHRLKGDSIPLMARILAVADAYDAMTTSRIYRHAMGHDRAVEILAHGAGSQWDSDAVQACLAVVGEKQLVYSGAPTQTGTATLQSDWHQISQALQVLQL
jgi:HD-GYP domain-containing protein (c-di-GMP phosphodiesterase class II)